MRSIIVFDQDPWVSALFNKLSASMPLNISFADEDTDADSWIRHSHDSILISNVTQSNLHELVKQQKQYSPNLKLLLLIEPSRVTQSHAEADLVLEKPIREAEMMGILSKVLYL